MSFFPDLEFGNRIQEKVLEVMNVSVYRVMEGNFPHWDVVAYQDNGIRLLEMKADRKTLETGNIVIEFIHNNKCSGIHTTKADSWIYCVVNDEEELCEVYDIPVSVLKEQISYQSYTEVKCCLNGMSYMYAFPKEVFYQWRIDGNGVQAAS